MLYIPVSLEGITDRVWPGVTDDTHGLGAPAPRPRVPGGVHAQLAQVVTVDHLAPVAIVPGTWHIVPAGPGAPDNLFTIEPTVVTPTTRVAAAGRRLAPVPPTSPSDDEHDGEDQDQEQEYQGQNHAGNNPRSFCRIILENNGFTTIPQCIINK